MLITIKSSFMEFSEIFVKFSANFGSFFGLSHSTALKSDEYVVIMDFSKLCWINVFNLS